MLTHKYQLLICRGKLQRTAPDLPICCTFGFNGRLYSGGISVRVEVHGRHHGGVGGFMRLRIQSRRLESDHSNLHRSSLGCIREDYPNIEGQLSQEFWYHRHSEGPATETKLSTLHLVIKSFNPITHRKQPCLLSLVVKGTTNVATQLHQTVTQFKIPHKTLTRENLWTLNLLLNSSQSQGRHTQKLPPSECIHSLPQRGDGGMEEFWLCLPKTGRMEVVQCCKLRSRCNESHMRSLRT